MTHAEGDSHVRTWGALAHLSSLINLGTAIGGFIAAFAIWISFKNQSPFVERQARESMNFQLTLLLAFVVTGVTVVGLLLWPVLWAIGIVLPIIAASRASEGTDHRYPFCLRPIAEPPPRTWDPSACPPAPAQL